MRRAALFASLFALIGTASASEHQLDYENNSAFDNTMQATLSGGATRVEIKLGGAERVPMRVRRWLGAMTNQGGTLRTCFVTEAPGEWNPRVLNIAGTSERYDAVADYNAIIEADPTDQSFAGVVLLSDSIDFGDALSGYPECPAG